MGTFGQNGEDRLLAAKVQDLIQLCTRRQYPLFTNFLTTEEYAAAESAALKLNFHNYLFYGGFDDSERNMFGAFPDYMEPDASQFPVSPLVFSFPEAYNLSHRDFLGALMGTGIKREAVGDILITQGRAVVFVKEELSDYITAQVDKIGRVGVKIETADPVDLPQATPPVELSFTVASMRLDNIVAAVTNLSREKSAKLIASGMVFVNHQEKDSVSMVLKTEDSLVIRGKGKFVIGSQDGLTKKGRVRIIIKQYR